MDIKEYIASGIIESFVLGTASDQERQEVRCMSSIYPEINEAVRSYEKKLNHLADANAIQPPKELKEQVLNALFEEIDKDIKTETDSKRKVLPINTSPEIVGRMNIWKITAAASFVLFIIASSVFINSRSNYNTLKSSIDQREEAYDLALTKAKKQIDTLDQSLSKFNNQLAFLSNKQTKQVQLSGTEKSIHSDVSVYWNQASNNVLLKVNELPQTPSKKQYQLWAIIDDKPTDMGMLPVDNFGNSLIEMPYKAENPVAFAITLEEEGGKPEPNLEELYVIGNV